MNVWIVNDGPKTVTQRKEIIFAKAEAIEQIYEGQ